MSLWLKDSIDFLKKELRKVDTVVTKSNDSTMWYMKCKRPKKALALFAWYRQHGAQEQEAIEYASKDIVMKGIPEVEISLLPYKLRTQILVHPGVLYRKVTMKPGRKGPIGWIGKVVGLPQRGWEPSLGKTYRVWAVPREHCYILVPISQYDSLTPRILEDEGGEFSIYKNLVNPAYWTQNSPELLRVGAFLEDKRLGIERYQSFEEFPKAKNYEFVTFLVTVIKGGRMRSALPQSKMEFAVNTGDFLLETTNGYYFTQEENSPKNPYNPLRSSTLDLDLTEE